MTSLLLFLPQLKNSTMNLFLTDLQVLTFLNILLKKAAKKAKFLHFSSLAILTAFKIKEQGISGISEILENDDTFTVKTIYDEETTIAKKDVMAERCIACKSKKVVIFDEMIGENGEEIDSNRFDIVAKLEAMTPDERFEFWQNELSKCIRCNACRNVCPACTCEKCVFDNDNSGIAQKAASNSFEENMFHIIRAFHVAGRCTDCGECSRVCPQGIPLHLLNRKFIKDANELYGEYQAGADMDTRPPLVNFTFDDCEPSVVYDRGGNK
jgi:ferredoxin